jgi:hypothetical protein
MGCRGSDIDKRALQVGAGTQKLNSRQRMPRLVGWAGAGTPLLASLLTCHQALAADDRMLLLDHDGLTIRMHLQVGLNVVTEHMARRSISIPRRVSSSPASRRIPRPAMPPTTRLRCRPLKRWLSI